MTIHTQVHSTICLGPADVSFEANRFRHGAMAPTESRQGTSSRGARASSVRSRSSVISSIAEPLIGRQVRQPVDRPLGLVSPAVADPIDQRGSGFSGILAAADVSRYGIASAHSMCPPKPNDRAMSR
jgi:hypothetical protein